MKRDLNEMECRMLCQCAIEARKLSYCPYSHFAVGAALLSADGTVFTGCNIENAAYTPSICAERTAFSKAVSEGHVSFTAIAIAGGPREPDPAEQHGEDNSISPISLPLCPPCGVCRQVMMEFCDPDSFRILLVSSASEYTVYTLKELLPLGFGPENISS